MHVGFIGLGQVGGKLAGSLLEHLPEERPRSSDRNMRQNKELGRYSVSGETENAPEGDFELGVFDADPAAMASFGERGAQTPATANALAADVDVLVTCLPSPAISDAVMGGPDGALSVMRPGSIWLEMSTTDAGAVKALAEQAAKREITVLDCPVSGGCHRAATGNIAIFAGGERADFERVLPLLTLMGHEILHTGPLGSASTLKVMTNYLASANLATLAEAFTVMAKCGIDLGTTYEAIRVSSGNSFVHETESQVILNGSRDVGFTMDLVIKDLGLFQSLADDTGTQLELSPHLLSIFKDGRDRYGGDEWSTNIIRRMEDENSVSVHAPGFPAELTDDEPRVSGFEVPVRKDQTSR